jgi:hypothetical protein
MTIWIKGASAFMFPHVSGMATAFLAKFAVIPFPKLRYHDLLHKTTHKSTVFSAMKVGGGAFCVDRGLKFVSKTLIAI